MDGFIDSQPENACDNADLDQSLMSFEQLDRNSPELWPQRIPGVTEWATENLTARQSPPKWLIEAEKCDLDMLHEFGSLSPAQLIEKIRGLHELSFQLGLDESHEMVRAKFLNIFSSPPPSQQQQQQQQHPVTKH